MGTSKKGKENEKVAKPKRKPAVPGRKPGRPKGAGAKVFNEKFIDQARIVCKEAGFTDKKLASLFGCCRSILAEWKKEHPEFTQAILEGRDDFNKDVAEKSLAMLCKGFTYKETTREPVIFKEKGETPVLLDPTLRITKVVTKRVVPHFDAIKFFLKTRDPKRWPPDKQIITGADGKPLVPENPMPWVLMPPMPKNLEEWEVMWKDHATAEGMLDAAEPKPETAGD